MPVVLIKGKYMKLNSYLYFNYETGLNWPKISQNLEILFAKFRDYLLWLG